MSGEEEIVIDWYQLSLLLYFFLTPFLPVSLTHSLSRTHSSSNTNGRHTQIRCRVL